MADWTTPYKDEKGAFGYDTANYDGDPHQPLTGWPFAPARDPKPSLPPRKARTVFRAFCLLVTGKNSAHHIPDTD